MRDEKRPEPKREFDGVILPMRHTFLIEVEHTHRLRFVQTENNFNGSTKKKCETLSVDYILRERRWIRELMGIRRIVSEGDAGRNPLRTMKGAAISDSLPKPRTTA